VGFNFSAVLAVRFDDKTNLGHSSSLCFTPRSDGILVMYGSIDIINAVDKIVAHKPSATGYFVEVLLHTDTVALYVDGMFVIEYQLTQPESYYKTSKLTILWESRHGTVDISNLHIGASDIINSKSLIKSKSSVSESYKGDFAFFNRSVISPNIDTKLTLMSQEYFERIGGNVEYGTFGEAGQILSMPISNPGRLYLSAKIKFNECVHSRTGNETILYIKNSDRGLYCKLELVCMKNGESTNAFPLYQSSLKATLGYGSNSVTLTSNLDNTFPFVGKDAFSIQYTGSVETDIALEITDTNFRLFRDGDNSTIATYDLSLFSTVRDLYDAIQSDIDSSLLTDYKLESFNSYDRPITDLVKITKVFLLQYKQQYDIEIGELIDDYYYDNFPIFIPYRDTNWHDVQIIINPANNDARALIDGRLYTFPFYDINNDRMYLADKGVDGYIYIGGNDDNTNHFNGQIKDVLVSSDIEKHYKESRNVILEGHAVNYSNTENPMGGTATTARLGRIFDLANIKGYKQMNCDELFSSISNGTAPAKTISVVYDDVQIPLYLNLSIRRFMKYYGHKPTLALLMGHSYTEAEKKAIHAMKAIGWSVAYHNYSHKQMGLFSYQQLVDEIDNSMIAMDEIGVDSDIWVYSYGSSSPYSRKLLQAKGFIASIDVGASSSLVSRGAGYYQITRTNIADSNSMDNIEALLI
jgi:hypothetical protein